MKIRDFLDGEFKVLNKIITPGKRGEWDDFATVTPIVINHPLKKGYIMYYQGQSKKSRDWRIGIAESEDLLDWKKMEDNPIIDYKDKKNIYQTDAAFPFKKEKYYLFCEERRYKRELSHSIKDIAKLFLPSFAKKFLWLLDRIKRDKIKISKYIEHSSDRYIVRFESDNPLKWDVSTKKILLSKQNLGIDFCSPKIYFFKGKYYLLSGIFDGKTKTALSQIRNPVNLEGIKLNIILESSQKGEWDCGGVIIVSIIEVEDGYIGFYEARDSDQTYQIGMAYSKDLKKWQKFSGNPVIRIKKGTFYERMVAAPYIFRENKKVYLLFTAYDWKMNNSIAIAELKNKGNNKKSMNPSKKEKQII
jgi:hypothetical protein